MQAVLPHSLAALAHLLCALPRCARRILALSLDGAFMISPYLPMSTHVSPTSDRRDHPDVGSQAKTLTPCGRCATPTATANSRAMSSRSPCTLPRRATRARRCRSSYPRVSRVCCHRRQRESSSGSGRRRHRPRRPRHRTRSSTSSRSNRSTSSRPLATRTTAAPPDTTTRTAPCRRRAAA